MKDLISIHAPMRGRHLACKVLSQDYKISIHAPMRGRPPDAAFGILAPGFQSTPPCGGDHKQPHLSSPINLFQSTPPCGGDVPPLTGYTKLAISIHAPMRGRRVRRGNESSCESISIHAPMRGRHPEAESPAEDPEISIHAPMRGRPWGHIFLILRNDFNPRPHAGATQIILGFLLLEDISIHAPMRGRLRVP